MYKSLQISRAVAALLVVVFHLGYSLSLDKYFGAKAINSLFIFGGGVGVSYFFVLSGFIITRVHKSDCGRIDRLLPYLKKRIVRIYPIYWFVFLLVSLTALSTPSLRNSVPHDSLILLKSLALIPQDSTQFAGVSAPVLAVAWSLQYEVLFYIVFAAFIVSPAFGWFLAAVAFGLFGFCQFTNCSFPNNFLGNIWVLLFAFGALVAKLSSLDIRLERPRMLAFLAALSILFSGLLEILVGRETFFIDSRIVYGVLSGVLILCLVSAESSGNLKLTDGFMCRLGDASYSLYLLHFPLITLCCKLLVKSGLKGLHGAIVAFPIILTSCIVLSMLLHRLVERPLLRRLSY